MNFQQLLSLHAAAEAIAADATMAGGTPSAELQSAIEAAEVQMRAMETPITAEALVGWRRVEYAYFDLYGNECGVSVIIQKDTGSVGVYIGATESWDEVIVFGATTMYDLGELVRLLGGASQ